MVIYILSKSRVSLGLKQLGNDPWAEIARRYPEGSRLWGKVSNITDYGCFVEIEDGVVTGNIIGDVVDGERKAELLARIAQHEGFSLEQTIAVGDGANDLPMLGIAGLGIAYHAKPALEAGAKARLRHSDLTALLHLQGYRGDEIARD